MSITLEPAITSFVEATNSSNSDALAACFASDAIVSDEQKTHQGASEIREWAIHTQDAYSFTLEPTDVVRQGGEVVVTCLVAGGFDGSPISLRFFFTLAEGKISALSIRD